VSKFSIRVVKRSAYVVTCDGESVSEYGTWREAANEVLAHGVEELLDGSDIHFRDTISREVTDWIIANWDKLVELRAECIRMISHRGEDS